MPCALGYLLLIADRTAPSSGIKSSCEAPDVAEGGEGKIVCTFEADINKLMQDFEVLHFAVVILHCAWYNNTRECHTKSGYEYENEISTILIIKMLKVTKDKAGQYNCSVARSEPEEIQSCNLNVTRQERSVDGEYLYIIPIVLGSALFLSSLIFILLLSTKFTHKLDDWLKIRTNIFYSGSIQNRVEESPREAEETEACL